MVELPKPIIKGTHSTRCLSDLLRPRKPEYESMFHPGQEHLGRYYLAPFQRPEVWTRDQARRLVESIYLGISIGSFVVSTTGEFDRKTGKFPHTAEWLIDGQQRMRALTKFFNNELSVFLGTKSEHKWGDLTRTQQLVTFDRYTVGIVILESMSEADLRRCYDRLNFGGTHHTEDQRAMRVL